jgi:hypothetical protein
MREIGLIPSSTGEPGGQETGQRVSHYIDPAGAIAIAYERCLRTNAPHFYRDRAGDSDAAKTRKRKAASKTNYTCPACELNAWAKPDANLMCGDCGESMEAEGDGE